MTNHCYVPYVGNPVDASKYAASAGSTEVSMCKDKLSVHSEIYVGVGGHDSGGVVLRIGEPCDGTG